jgi:hypothetical protein
MHDVPSVRMWMDGKSRRSKTDGGDFRVGAAALE